VPLLAELRLRDRPDMVRPPEAGLEGQAPNGAFAKPNNLDLAKWELAGFIRGREKPLIHQTFHPTIRSARPRPWQPPPDRRGG